MLESKVLLDAKQIHCHSALWFYFWNLILCNFFTESARFQISCRVDSVAELNKLCGQNSILKVIHEENVGLVTYTGNKRCIKQKHFGSLTL